MDKFTGVLTKIRLLKDNPLLVRFTLVTDNGGINCVVIKEILANQIMMLPDDKYTVSVKGHFNNKNQLVIRELRILDKDDFTHKLGM